jgi:hypothetical protein
VSNLHDFWGGDENADDKIDTTDAGVSKDIDVSAPCYQCYRTDATEYTQSREHDCLDVRCTRCNVEYSFRLPGLWRMLGLT